MGNSSNKCLSKHGTLPSYCEAYLKVVKSIVETNPTKTSLIRSVILYTEQVRTNEPSSDPYIPFVQTVHKLHPRIYRNKPLESVDQIWLYEALLRQIMYCKKIYPFLQNYEYKRWVKEYKRFLRDCKRFKHTTIVPNLIEDFIWHSHMQSPTYEPDVIKVLGRFLDHDDEIPEHKLQKFKTIRTFLRSHTPYDEKEDGTCATERPRPVYSSSNSGGSSCGSSCGGGGCGGCG